MPIHFKGVQVELLDGTDLSRSIYKKTKAKELLDNIFKMINLIEMDYFGIYYLLQSTGERVWLNPDQTVWSQIVKTLEPPYQLYFGVKFFPYDPLLLQEDITLYQMYMHLSKEVKAGRVICTDRERSDMLALILLAECGDTDERPANKIRNIFMNLQKISPDIENESLRKHADLKGMTATAAESKLMEQAMPLSYYDKEIYAVKSEAQPSLRKLVLTLGPVGIGLFQHEAKIDTFGWMEIWNVGYVSRTFWFRIIRDGEKSKHKFLLENNKVNEKLWKSFRRYFKFYIEEHKVDPKLSWGRVPPSVKRMNLLNDTEHPSSLGSMAIAPQISMDNIENLTSAF